MLPGSTQGVFQHNGARGDDAVAADRGIVHHYGAIPTSTLFSITQPCTIALCPTLTLFPIQGLRFLVSAVNDGPVLDVDLVADTYAVCHTHHSIEPYPAIIPMITSPTTVQLGARKQLPPMTGSIPLTGKISAIVFDFLSHHRSVDPFLANFTPVTI